MIHSLRKRIVIVNVVLASIILFAAVTLTFTLGFNKINNERDGRLNAALGFDPATSKMSFDENRLYRDIYLLHYNTYTGEARWFFGSDVPGKEEDWATKITNYLNSPDESGWMGMSMRYAKQTEGDIVKVAIMDMRSRDSGMSFYMLTVFFALFIALGCFFIVSFFVAKISLRPVEESWKKQKQFVADASHELKTPLSVIMANTDIIASHQDETVASQMRWIENTRAESKRMADLVADLLFLAKNDDGLKVAMQDMDLSDCINTTVLTYEAIFYENNKEFTYSVQPDVHIVGNGGQLTQLITILLDNANKYSVGKGNIALNLEASGKHIVLTVENDSEPLTEEQIDHLFDRFYTVDTARNKNSSGNGLGLSIAKIICETHNGTISAECENGRTVFTADFTLKKQKKEKNR